MKGSPVNPGVREKQAELKEQVIDALEGLVAALRAGDAAVAMKDGFDVRNHVAEVAAPHGLYMIKQPSGRVTYRVEVLFPWMGKRVRDTLNEMMAEEDDG